MLRPATPLSALLLIAFALLLLSVLSTPVIKAIPLGSFKDVTFGVFGYCRTRGCSSIGIGYDTADLFPQNSQAFNLPSGVRRTLSSILVVHPVAAFLTLVMFIMAVTAHTHAASHSTRYLLIFFILNIINFLLCLVAFIVDVLIFMPHMAWGTYVVLAATVLVLLSGLVSCAMRRTLTNRKSNKERIAQNAEMSGENYYNRQEQQKTSFGMSTTSQPAVPTISGGSGNDSLPVFASYEAQNRDEKTSDDRLPLTQRTPSERSPHAMHATPNDMANAAAVGVMNHPQRSASQDRYGNNAGGSPDAYGAPKGPPYDRMNRGGRQGPDPAFGYGGGRGGHGPPMRGRGGYGPPARGGYGPRGGRGGYGPPPPRNGYAPGAMMRNRGPSPSPSDYSGPAGYYDRRPSADSYGPYGGQRPPPPSDPSTVYNNAGNNSGFTPYNPELDLPRAESPPPLPGSEPAMARGNVIEMDATPAGSSANNGHGNYGQIRDNDSDVAGMVGLQQGMAPVKHDAYMSDGSRYEEEEYVPPRAGWNQSPGGQNLPSNPQRQPTIEVSGGMSPTRGPSNNNNYYEYVDPRFASSQNNRNDGRLLPPPIEAYEDVHASSNGARSPAESERSNFTSISQRGINPQWNPNAPPMPSHPHAAQFRKPVQQRHDVLLDNPDFKLAGGRLAGQRGGGGLTPGSAYPTGPMA